MNRPRILTFGACLFAFVLLILSLDGHGQPLAARSIYPNLVDNVDRPLRYRPDGPDFVIENGAEFFNRPLYGGNTAFRVDGGDKPEFSLYLPGRGGNLRLAIRSAHGEKWVHDAASIVTRYRPGELLYEIRDPLLGKTGVLRLSVLAYQRTEGLIVRVEATGIGSGIELAWAYGGANGKRGARDGDIGTERVPISEYFQLQPEACRDNKYQVTGSTFTLHAKAATILGLTSTEAQLSVGDAAHWNDLPALLAGAPPSSPSQPLIIGRAQLIAEKPVLISLQRIATDAAIADELDIYKAVTEDRAGIGRTSPKLPLTPAFHPNDLSKLFDETERSFAALRNRVSVDTPDPFLNAAVGALNIAADAVWDAPQNDIMHGAIAWRTRLLGWRGPYLLDALGWHDRARAHFIYWAGRQNTDPIPDKVPPPEEKTNLARNEAGLHSNGDLSNSHYDMNLVYIDALFRHLLWTGDVAFAKKMWPVIERHLAWERRLFRREFGPEKLPLYEAYAAIWASDDLQYSGGGAAHASAYNYYHNKMAAQVASLIGVDPAPYAREATLIARGMREMLWLRDRGWFAESKDLLGLQLVHPYAAVWSFYHTMDSGLPTRAEGWRMTQQIDTQIPHLPVHGDGVPAGLHTLATTNWMPYTWSINNVVMAEAIHTALGFWQAGRPEEAWRITEGSLLAAMFMGISPGNVGSMSYLDVYRRESQRDFADGSGVLSRALVEGLFGVRPDALARELWIEPGFPRTWTHAQLHHPNLNFSFQRKGDNDQYVIEPAFSVPMKARLVLRVTHERVADVEINGNPVAWKTEPGVGQLPARIVIEGPVAARTEVTVQWAGRTLKTPEPAESAPKDIPTPPVFAEPPTNPSWSPVDLGVYFNDRVTQIFRNEYRSPRSPYVSLAQPKQGIGGWAGTVNELPDIDDTGLRAAATKNGGQVILPDGVPFATPAKPGTKNIIFTSQWDNYPREVVIPLLGQARELYLLMAGSTNPMQSHLDNGEIVVTYRDGKTARLALENPTNWWPIDQDYFIDDFQFRRPGPLPPRIDLKTGRIRMLDEKTFKGKGHPIPGGAATAISMPLDPSRELESFTVRAVANEVVIGVMSATLSR